MEQQGPASATIGRRSTTVSGLYAALLTAARRDTPTTHTLVALLGMIGLRVGEAVDISVTDLRSQSGYELLTIMAAHAVAADLAGMSAD